MFIFKIGLWLNNKNIKPVEVKSLLDCSFQQFTQESEESYLNVFLVKFTYIITAWIDLVDLNHSTWSSCSRVLHLL